MQIQWYGQDEAKHFDYVTHESYNAILESLQILSNATKVTLATDSDHINLLDFGTVPVQSNIEMGSPESFAGVQDGVVQLSGVLREPVSISIHSLNGCEVSSTELQIGLTQWDIKFTCVE